MQAQDQAMALPWLGKYHRGPHPALRGKQWMVKAEDWKSSMKQRYESWGPYISKEAAAYPAKMNQILALKIVNQAREYRRLKGLSMKGKHYQTMGKHGNVRVLSNSTAETENKSQQSCQNSVE